MKQSRCWYVERRTFGECVSDFSKVWAVPMIIAVLVAVIIALCTKLIEARHELRRARGEIAGGIHA